MQYVVSDIHGEYDKFLSLLELIKFSKKDKMYVIGDAIDRGEKSLEVLLEIAKTPNIQLILGNHEELMKMALNVREDDKEFDFRLNLWYQCGGLSTISQILVITKENLDIVTNLLNNSPYIIDDLKVGKHIFQLTHGQPLVSSDEDIRKLIWGKFDKGKCYFENKIAIVGHIATNILQEDKPYRIWKGNNIIDIDCGIAVGDSNSRLGCLCLNNFKEYYI